MTQKFLTHHLKLFFAAHHYVFSSKDPKAIAGDLIVGSGDDTCLVIIRHGRLSLTQQIADALVSIFDERLLICL